MVKDHLIVRFIREGLKLLHEGILDWREIENS